MEKVINKYGDVDELVDKLARIETEKFKKIFEQKGLENGLLTVGRVLALYQVLVQTNEAAHSDLASLSAQISELEKSQSFSRGEKFGTTKAAKAGALARGHKYSVMKKAALEWYKSERQRFKNKDDAANEIIKLHPVEFSTARGWLTGV